MLESKNRLGIGNLEAWQKARQQQMCALRFSPLDTIYIYIYIYIYIIQPLQLDRLPPSIISSSQNSLSEHRPVCANLYFHDWMTTTITPMTSSRAKFCTVAATEHCGFTDSERTGFRMRTSVRGEKCRIRSTRVPEGEFSFHCPIIVWKRVYSLCGCFIAADQLPTPNIYFDHAQKIIFLFVTRRRLILWSLS